MNTTAGSTMELAQQQFAMYEKNKAGFRELLATSDAPRHILRYAYESLVRQHKIIAIEDMLIEEKTIAWKTAKDVAGERLNKTELIHLVKALIAIEYFLSLKKK